MTLNSADIRLKLITPPVCDVFFLYFLSNVPSLKMFNN